MTIYPYRAANISTASGATSQQTLNIRGGLCRQVYIIANTSTTIFKVNIQDESNLKIMDYPSHTGILNDVGMAIPMAGKYTISITNASPDDIFNIFMGVQE